MMTLKRTFFPLICVLISTACSFDGDKTQIDVQQLPQQVTKFISTKFKGQKIKYATKEKAGNALKYEVLLVNGTEIEFDNNGNWTEIDGNSKALPNSFIPQAIRNYVKANYKGQAIKEIKRNPNGYEIELSNEVEIKFNKNFKAVKIDK